MEKNSTKVKHNKLFSKGSNNSNIQHPNNQAEISFYTKHKQCMQVIHGMFRSRIGEIKRGEAYLVEKVQCLLCLFELQKLHQQCFVVFK